MFEFDEKCLYQAPEKPRKPLFTLQEEMIHAKVEMREAVERVLDFEKYLEHRFDDMLKHLTTDNVTFKETFAGAHTEFTKAVQTEINEFEKTVSATIELFKASITTDYANIEKLVKDGDETILRTFIEKLNAYVDETYDYLKFNLNATITKLIAEMKNDGELVNIINRELEINVANDYYNVTQATDLTSAIDYCKTNSKIFYIPFGKTVSISNTLDLTGLDVDIRGTLKVNHNGIGVIVGDSTLRTANIYIREIAAPNYIDGDISIRVVGVKRARVTIDYAPSIQLYANGDVDGQSSIAYSVFNVLSCKKFMIYDEPNTTAQGWINENTFNVERVTEELSIIGNTNQHNNNVFNKPCIEGGKLTLKNCRRNKFYNLRNEGMEGIELDANTWQNVIIYNYHTEMLYNRGSNFVDNGRDNVVECEGWQNNRYIPIYAITPRTVQNGLYKIGDEEFYTVNESGITPTETYKDVIKDIIIPATNIKRIRAVSDNASIRIRIGLLNSAGTPVNNGGTYGGKQYQNGVFYYGVQESNLQQDGTGMIYPNTSAVAQTIDILDQTAEYIKISVQTVDKKYFKYLMLYVGCDERNTPNLEYLKYSLMSKTGE